MNEAVVILWLLAGAVTLIAGHSVISQLRL